MAKNGRITFEDMLKRLLRRHGIPVVKMPKEDIIRRVFENEYRISRMAELFLQFTQRAKRRGWSPNDVRENIERLDLDTEDRVAVFHELALRMYREYEGELKRRHRIDFDDLLIRATKKVQRLGEDARICHDVGVRIGQLRWILLDEYQDFTELYYRMISAILQAVPEVRVLAVGDDWQAINGFSGSELRFFSGFSDYFRGGESVSIRTNYRSDREIVDAGNRLMQGRGPAGRASQTGNGHIEECILDYVWIEFRQGDQYAEAREADAIYLPYEVQKNHPSESETWCAKALKKCVEIIQQKPDKKTFLLSRTNRVYGIPIEKFSTYLLCALSSATGISQSQLRDTLEATTVHRSKGREAHTVIILDATERQFPKIHPDNLLFGLFGTSPREVLDEERRLFYVAMTRAERRLFVLTRKGEESPFLSEAGFRHNCLRQMPEAIDDFEDGIPF